MTPSRDLLSRAALHDPAIARRPGPATWELGNFPKDQEKYPVSGVSWFEAAAYAKFAGKELPTIFHWNRAAQTPAGGVIVPRSNFGGGPVAVGSHDAMSGFGTFDMAGNLKEWCWNRADGEKRYILGGGFGEPDYMFIDQDAQLPWDRRPRFGFRCVKLLAKPAEAAARPIWIAQRDFAKEKPVSDALFRTYQSLYSYDKTPLKARIEEVDRSNHDWTVERISMNAAYGGETLIAYLYLPKSGRPPYQTLVYFPGSGALHTDKLYAAMMGGAPGRYVDVAMLGGRALIFPIYKSTYERRDELTSDYPSTTALWRDHMIAWYRDMARSIDYLETRKDIDTTRLAYYGLSWGGAVGPPLVSLEPRFKTAVFLAGGMNFQSALPEADSINFAPRVKIPVLMINGKYDHFFPVESSQIPMFRLLGTPAKDKRHVIIASGHAPPRPETIREVLDWLDRYLGPTATSQ